MENNIFQYLLLQFITVLHILFVLFVVLTPFLGSNYMLLMHFFLVPFLIFHWITNDNTCCLTIAERIIRKKLYKQNNQAEEEEKIEDDCITCKIINPVYDVHKNYDKFTIFIYIITIMLWIITVGKLTYKYNTGSINSFMDLIIN